MIARPAAKFARPRVHVSLIARPYERRSVCVMTRTQVNRRTDLNETSGCCGGNHTHYTRDRVIDLVERHEMTFLDRKGNPTARHTNLATYTEKSAGTWQKTRSGPVCTMQLKVGFKGRHVPAGQREAELVLA